MSDNRVYVVKKIMGPFLAARRVANDGLGLPMLAQAEARKERAVDLSLNRREVKERDL